MSTYVIKIFNQGDRDEQERLLSLYRYSSDAIVIINGTGTVVSINPAAVRLTGHRAGETVGRFKCTDLLCCRDDKGESLCGTERCGLNPLRKREPMPYYEMSIATRRGEWLPITASSSLLPSLLGESLVAIIMRDLREKRKLERELARRRYQLEALYQIGLELSSIQDAGKNLGAVLDRVRGLLGSEVATIHLRDEISGALYCKALSGAHTGEFMRQSLLCGQHLAERVVNTGKPVMTRDFPFDLMEGPDSFRFVGEDDIRSALAVPLQVNGKAYGALFVGHRRRAAFASDELTLLSNLAHQISIALENLSLYQQVQNYAVLEERERLAREMHDGLAQTLTYLNAKIATVQEYLRQGKQGKVLEELALAREMLQEAHREVRRWIFNLKAKPRDSDFLCTLNQYLQEFSRQNGTETRLITSIQGELTLPEAVEIQLSRIIQEALANVRKHADATRAWIAVEKNDKEVSFTVGDNGRGFAMNQEVGQDGHHFGLAIMRERAKSVGGILELYSAPGLGTRITVKLPFISSNPKVEQA